MSPREAATVLVADAFTRCSLALALGFCLGAIIAQRWGDSTPLVGAVVFVSAAQFSFASVVSRRVRRLAWTALTADQAKAWREAAKLPVAAALSGAPFFILTFAHLAGVPLEEGVATPAVTLVTFGLLLQIPGPILASSQLHDVPAPSRREWREGASRYQYWQLVGSEVLAALLFLEAILVTCSP